MARHCSAQAALDAQEHHATKTARYLDWLAEHGPATDHDAAAALHYPLSSICSIRNSVLEHVRVRGKGTSPYGKPATLWRRA